MDPEQVKEALTESVPLKLSNQHGATGTLLNTPAGLPTGASDSPFDVQFPTATEGFGAAWDLALGPVFNLHQQL